MSDQESYLRVRGSEWANIYCFRNRKDPYWIVSQGEGYGGFGGSRFAS